MLKINGSPVTLGHFPDGTMLVKQELPEPGRVTVSWNYEDDRELIGLVYLTNHLRSHGFRDLELWMPYIPNARQDRVKSSEDVFTLKWFAGMINSLSFSAVRVLDPHSSVSEALIDNIRVESPKPYILRAIEAIRERTGEDPAMFYPDEGAGKRYGGMIELPYAFGIKKRDWKTGRIQGLDAAGAVENIAGRTVLIVDDICSRGGTFYHSAKKLMELGAKEVCLYITHCEDTIAEGELLKGDLIRDIWTTDSIITVDHEKIHKIHL